MSKEYMKKCIHYKQMISQLLQQEENEDSYLALYKKELNLGKYVIIQKL